MSDPAWRDRTGPPPGDVAVLYRDERLLAVDKPSGMMVHRGWGRAPVVLVDVVRGWTGGGKVHPAHRLDRGTSGVVLFALDAETARVLGARFDARQVHKSYVALVRGRTPDEGVIDHPIPRRKGGPRVPAVTVFLRLATVPARPRHLSLVLAWPRTGRLHQVRRHLAHVDHPLIGDSSHGKGALNRAATRIYGLRRLALHALELRLPHPDDGRPLRVLAPLPADLTEPLARMGFAADLLDAERLAAVEPPAAG